MNTYCKRTWLNNNESSSTGACVAFHGKAKWQNHKEEETVTFFEVSDCHCKARLHKIASDSMNQFIDKLRLLSSEAAKFADFLENQINE